MATSSLSRLEITCPNCGTENSLITNHLTDREEIDCSHCKKRLGTFGELRTDARGRPAERAERRYQPPLVRTPHSQKWDW